MVDRASSADSWRAATGWLQPGDICVLTKADLTAGGDAASARSHAEAAGLEVLEVSVEAGRPAELEARLERKVVDALGGAEFPAATRARHADLLTTCLSHVDRALERLDEPELAAEDLRLAARSMERITGAVGVEDILDRVFATFCIGK